MDARGDIVASSESESESGSDGGRNEHGELCAMVICVWRIGYQVSQTSSSVVRKTDRGRVVVLLCRCGRDVREQQSVDEDV